MTRQAKDYKESYYRQEYNCSRYPLTGCRPVEIFQFIYLLACLHNYVRIEQQAASVKKAETPLIVNE
jgi:hypothetical protein